VLLKLVVPYVDRMFHGGCITKWHKAEGEWVNPGDDLFDIQIADGVRVLRAYRRPAQVLKGNRLSQMIHSCALSLRVTSSDMGFMRRIYASPGAHRQVGEVTAVLTTEENEPLEKAGEAVAEVSEFRVIADYIQPA
jgi:pyruvate/2-oxoglutarate dehydrogenase complex dihydrolipoamide acyltransferase (E2) component